MTKCKICGHRTNTLPAMRLHYSKKHPDSMKHKKGVSRKIKRGKYCSECGREI